MGDKAVLVVDDQSTAREVLSLAFEAAGFMVVSAEDGDEALRIVEERRPDVVVTDIHMPRVNGREFARRLRRRFGARSPALVAMTADQGLLAGLRQDPGFFAVLEKPVDVFALLAAVREAIEARQTGDAEGSRISHETEGA